MPAVTSSSLSPALWAGKFEEGIAQDLVSYDNPKGTVTNSDLELAGGVGHQGVLQQKVRWQVEQLSLFSDNAPALAWQHEGSTSTLGPAACLLCLSSLHQ